jgi:hypothetical protein
VATSGTQSHVFIKWALGLSSNYSTLKTLRRSNRPAFFRFFTGHGNSKHLGADF